MKDRNQLVRLQRHLRHEIAGLDMLGIGDPGAKCRRFQRKRPRGHRRPAADMREIRSQLSAGLSPPDAVAERASATAEQVLALLAERIRGAVCALVLVISPLPELIRWQGDDGERHVRVLKTAELRALPPIDSGLLGGELEFVLLAGDEV